MDTNHPLHHVELEAQEQAQGVSPLEAAQRRIAELEAELAEVKRIKDSAYNERNRVVAALAKVFPSGTAKTAIEGWDESWHGCVYIQLSTGQISYHYHDSEAHLFADLPAYTGQWDGHDKDEVHRRLASLGFGPHRRYFEEFIHFHRVAADTCLELHGHEIANIRMWCDKLEKLLLGIAMAQEAGKDPKEFWT